MKRAVASDAHILPGPTDLCDYAKLERFATTCIEARVDEAILAGDIIDRTRGANVSLAAALLWEHFGRLLAPFGIPITYILGNHDYAGADTNTLAYALYAAKFAGGTFTISTGPEVRGEWVIDHGNDFDPWCRTPGGVLTEIGEAATAVDAALDKIHVDIEALNPTNWRSPEDVPAFDLPTHRAVNRWAVRYRQRIVVGHSHVAYDMRVDDARVLNVGALALGAPFTVAIIDDDGTGALVR